MFEVPAVGVLDFFEEQSALRALRGRAFVFGHPVEDALRAAQNIFVHGSLLLEIENLWHVTGH